MNLPRTIGAMSYQGTGLGLGATPSISAEPKSWAISQAQRYHRLRRSGSTRLTPTEFLKQQIEQSSRPSLAWVVLYPGFASELSRLDQTGFRVPTTATPSIRSTGNTSRTTTPSIRSTGNTRPRGSVSDATIEAVALAAKSMAKDYGKAMSENARTLRQAGFNDGVMRKAFSSTRSLKTYLAAARYIGCGGSKQTALQYAAEQVSNPDSNRMYYKAYMQCRKAGKAETSATKTPSSEVDAPLPIPEVMVDEEPASMWKYVAIGAGALAAVGIGIAILK